VNLSPKQPPNYDQFRQFFPGFEEFKPVFCYGSTIYNPFDQEITPDLVHHEEVHSKQQGKNPEFWYSRYFREPHFRLDQEVEAYRAQYAFVNKRVVDRELKAWFLNRLASSLSSPLYGNLVSHQEAWKLIRRA